MKSKKRTVCTITQNRWTSKQIDALLKNYGVMTTKEIAELVGRSVQSVLNRINYEKKLGTIV